MAESPKKSIVWEGFTVEHLNDEESLEVMKNYSVFSDGIIRLNPGGWIFPARFPDVAHRAMDINYSEEDVMIMSFPKSGTTWTQEIAWNLLNNPDQNNSLAETCLDLRSPDLELFMVFSATGCLVPNNLEEHIKLYDKKYPGCRKEREYQDHTSLYFGLFNDMPKPRVIKCHEPFALLPKNLLEKTKVIYIARNIYDTANSFYHFGRLDLLWGFRGTLDEFVDYFVAEKVPFGPFYAMMKQAWDRRNDPNLLFLYYEDLIEDPIREIKKIDKFLETNRTDEQIKEVAKFTSFGSLKERFKDNPPASNNLQYYNREIIEKESGGFFRKGEVGDWKKHFNVTQRQKLQQYEEKNLKMFGPDFKYNKSVY